jgi:hypothetical protein
MGKRLLTEGKLRCESEEYGQCCSSPASLASASWRIVEVKGSINGRLILEAGSGRFFLWDASVGVLSFFERRHPRCLSWQILLQNSQNAVVRIFR